MKRFPFCPSLVSDLDVVNDGGRCNVDNDIV